MWCILWFFDINPRWFSPGALSQRKPKKRRQLQGRPPDGWFKEYYEDGKLKVEGKYKQGLRDGEFKEYFQDGTVRIISNYLENELFGPFKDYREDGSLKRECNYNRLVANLDKLVESENFSLVETSLLGNNSNKGKIEGVFKDYFSNGQLESQYHYVIVDGFDVWQGPFVRYYENGQVKSEGGFNNGAFHGVFRDYDETGLLISERSYDNGRKIDKSTSGQNQ